jgi:translation initiation factor IF-1
MLPADACVAPGVIVAALGPGVWRVELPNGHQLVARVRRRDCERPEVGRLAPGGAVSVAVVPGDMSRGWVMIDQQT